MADVTMVEDFELPDATGTLRRLSSFLSAGPVVLFFYPAAMSKGCTIEACHFRDVRSELHALGAQAIGISTDTPDDQRRFDEEHGLGYPLLADVDGKVATALGVKRRFGPLPVRRATFVIAPDRRVLGVVRSEVRMERHADRAIEILREHTSTTAGST